MACLSSDFGRVTLYPTVTRWVVRSPANPANPPGAIRDRGQPSR